MSEFFERRLDGYDQHMLTNIESAIEFYPFTASAMPSVENCRILDLGCGTGLELEEYFRICPTAKVVGIDLSAGMLRALEGKFPDRDITLLCGSYFDLPFGEEVFDGAVSVESLHHFTRDEKLPLYAKLYKALVGGGYFILTDYFALSDEEELLRRREFEELKASEGVSAGEFYHYDTPLTVSHEIGALLDAGFDSVEVLGIWGATHMLKAIKKF